MVLITILDLLKNILFFFKKPSEKEIKKPIKLIEFFILLFFSISFGIFVDLLLNIFNTIEIESKLEDIFFSNKLIFIFFGIFIAPLIEEMIFRFHLSLNYKNILLSMLLSLFLIGGSWFYLILLWLYLFFLYLTINRYHQPSLKFMIHFSSLLFSLIHLENYSNFDYYNSYYILPFLLSIQFTIGLILSYIRLQHGIFWAILFHSTYNACLLVPFAIFNAV